MREVVVVGGGAAGLLAAIFAARGGANTTLIERTQDGGRKILISGGGRCNVLPTRVSEERFVTDSSRHTLHRIIRSWPLAEQIEFFQSDLGIPLEEEPESLKFFPASQKARDVRDGLVAAARRAGVTLAMARRVMDVEPVDERWRVACDDGRSVDADAVVMATGGLSVPATGSDGEGLNMLRRLGHSITPTYAALAPITVEPNAFTALAGVSLMATITAQAGEEEAVATGGFLFTHRGYSGPAVLNVSHIGARARSRSALRAALRVRWTSHDDVAWTHLLAARGARTVGGAVRAVLPERLASVLIALAAVDPLRTLAELRRDERLRLIDTLVRGALPAVGDEGYKKAEVTGGGVNLAEINPRTMESRRHAGLFLCGELLDAFGPIGGYNFLWAWATGRAAGQGAAG